MIELYGEGLLFQILMIADVSSGWGGGYEKTATKSTDIFYVWPPTLVFCRQTKRNLGRKRPQMEFFGLLELFRCNLLDLSFSFFSSKATFGNKTNPFYDFRETFFCRESHFSPALALHCFTTTVTYDRLLFMLGCL